MQCSLCGAKIKSEKEQLKGRNSGVVNLTCDKCDKKAMEEIKNQLEDEEVKPEGEISEEGEESSEEEPAEVV
jgi:ribosome-binding protein aMBF1 (putative translation factor)